MLGHSPLRAAARPNITLPFTRCRYCRTPPEHRCPRRRRRQQRQRVTEGTAMAPWNGPNNKSHSERKVHWRVTKSTFFNKSTYLLITLAPNRGVRRKLWVALTLGKGRPRPCLGPAALVVQFFELKCRCDLEWGLASWAKRCWRKERRQERKASNARNHLTTICFAKVIIQPTPDPLPALWSTISPPSPLHSGLIILKSEVAELRVLNWSPQPRPVVTISGPAPVFPVCLKAGVRRSNWMNASR